MTIVLLKGQSITERARPERTWSPINGDQLLSLLGMVSTLLQGGFMQKWYIVHLSPAGCLVTAC